MAARNACAVQSAPLVIASTSLPKIPLSYRWVIYDAKTFFKRRRELLSPSFSTSLPLKYYNEVIWKVYANKEYGQPKNLIISLDNDDNDRDDDDEDLDQSSVLISKCQISVLHPETSEVLFSHTINNEVVDVCNSSSSLQCTLSKYPKYIINDTLIIEVDATICCYSEPKENKETYLVPMDNIRKELHTLYRDEVLSDVTIKCEGKEFKAHKAILASQSPVFKKMFELDMKESRSNVVDVVDVEPEVMSNFCWNTFIQEGLRSATRSYFKLRTNTNCQDWCLYV